VIFRVCFYFLKQKQFDATYGAMVDPNTGRPMDAETAKRVAMADPAAVAIAQYQVAPPTMSRGGQGAAIMRRVLAINPAYNAQNWQAQGNLLKSYTSGKQSTEINGINTALGHVGTLGDAIDALNNGDVQVLNRIANGVGAQVGSSRQTTFQAIVHKVAPAINRAYVGGVGSQGEIQTQESDFDPRMSPAQLKSNVATTVKLLRSKIGSLENQWKQTMGNDADFEGRFIMPEAKSVVDKWSGGAVPTKPAAGAPGAVKPKNADEYLKSIGR